MGTKNNPGQFDCYSKADGDEPIFVLRGKDPVAANLVREWVHRRLMYELATKGVASEDMNKFSEALQVAKDIDEYRINYYMSGGKAKKAGPVIVNPEPCPRCDNGDICITHARVGPPKFEDNPDNFKD